MLEHYQNLISLHKSAAQNLALLGPRFEIARIVALQRAEARQWDAYDLDPELEIKAVTAPTMTSDIVNKIRQGDGLTDGELDVSIAFFEVLVQQLDDIGPHFHLAWVDCHRTLLSLQQSKSFRARR